MLQKHLLRLLGICPVLQEKNNMILEHTVTLRNREWLFLKKEVKGLIEEKGEPPIDSDDYRDLYSLKWIQHRLERTDDSITSTYNPGDSGIGDK